ncbi:MAG TPA: hypothetical protein VFV50_00010 [Bdellovibrionales bacterium]|nr:hypothetical protein [Bdellovibrionales bacterium]
MGKLVYEMKPWIFIVIAAAGVVGNPSSKLAGLSSMVLLGCALLILQWRFEYRKAVKKYRPHA